MGGGYISCGDFHGDDKSGSAISGVFDELPKCIPESDREHFATKVLLPLLNQLEETGEYFLIEKSTAEQMKSVVDALYRRFKERFGDADVWDVMEMDGSYGVDPTDAKWGKGVGWQYYCVTDLRSALQHCIETGEPVCVSFD